MLADGTTRSRPWSHAQPSPARTATPSRQSARRLGDDGRKPLRQRIAVRSGPSDVRSRHPGSIPGRSVTMGPVPPGPPAPPGVPMRVVVPVTTLWSAPDRPRRVDAPIVADHPDHTAWLDRPRPARRRRRTRAGPAGAARPGTDPGGRRRACARPGSARSNGYPRRLGARRVPWQPTSLDPRATPGGCAWRTSSPTTPAATATAGGRLLGRPPRPGRSRRPRLRSRAPRAAATCGAGPPRWGWTAPDWSTRSTATWAGSSRGTPTTSRRPVRRYRSPRLSPATSTSSPGATTAAHHVGIVTGPGRMVHASGGRSVVEEDLDAGAPRHPRAPPDGWWTPRLLPL